MKNELNLKLGLDGRRALTVFRTHTTKQNLQLTLSEMSDEHLVNTIAMFLDPVIHAVKLSKKEVPDTLAHLVIAYNAPKHSPHDLATLTIDTMIKVQPYLVEAYLRGLPEPVVLLQEVLQRKGGNISPLDFTLNNNIIDLIKE